MPLDAKDVLPLIPARSGSTGVPRKNIRPLPDGSTLLSRAIECARAVFGQCVVSTDDGEIATYAEMHHAEVIMRQRDGDGPMLGVVQEAVGLFPDTRAVALLQPTSPFRQEWTVASALDLLTDEHTAVVSISPVPQKCAAPWRLNIYAGKLAPQAGDWSLVPTRRQAIVSNEYVRDGVIYLTRADVIRRGSLYGHAVAPLFTPENERLNVDTWDDWAILEARLR